MKTIIFILSALFACVLQNMESRTMEISHHNLEESKINGPAEYREMWSLSKFDTKYEAPNMEEKALNGAKDDTIQHSLPSDMFLRHDKLRTADSNGDKSQSSEEKISNISESDNPHGISISSNNNFLWHRKSLTKYPSITEEQNTHFSSGDQHYPEKFQNFSQTASELGALDAGTDPRERRAFFPHLHFHARPRAHPRTHPHTRYLKFLREGTNHKRRFKVNEYSLYFRNEVPKYKKKYFVNVGEELAGSNETELRKSIEGEAKRIIRSEDYINSQIEGLKAFVKREIAKEESARIIKNRGISRKREQSLSHNRDTDDSSSSFEYEDEAEQNRRIVNNIESRIEAIKDALRKEFARREITRRTENIDINKKSEESPSHNNNGYDNQELENFRQYEASVLHGEGGDTVQPAVFMNAKAAISNIQDGKNNDSIPQSYTLSKSVAYWPKRNGCCNITRNKTKCRNNCK
ncbi:uncharacterized protein LOC110828215 isoform X2 [Zootermopsis nevadensis]|uniref:uncharacterized protein LOC110828215 isoform X2 n=1 Tax=Zootermopsis nevadensis TaxID=136037 RepID=UPI000B8E905D|nr:uncharacterized protein LOC110828215 isoform X2 [Zootermopsis nevadensis]